MNVNRKTYEGDEKIVFIDIIYLNDVNKQEKHRALKDEEILPLLAKYFSHSSHRVFGRKVIEEDC